MEKDSRKIEQYLMPKPDAATIRAEINFASINNGLTEVETSTTQLGVCNAGRVTTPCPTSRAHITGCEPFMIPTTGPIGHARK